MQRNTKIENNLKNLSKKEKSEKNMNFEAFNLHPKIMAGIRMLDYQAPTPIQQRSIPPVMEGRDVMGLAQTGTGKTAAFVLPILHRLMTGPRKCVRALILAPTRELAEQTHEAIGRLGRNTQLKSATVYGGVNQNTQISRLRGGAEIVVACPGRLIDLLNQGVIDLTCMEALVLDEADRMFDMGFLPDVRKILSRLPAQRQTLLFSATMPDDVRALAATVLQNPVSVRIGDTVPVSTVSHAIYPVDPHLKTPLLLRILDRKDVKSALVFTRTKARTTRLANQMKKSGYPAASLQGDLSQNRRQEAIDGFRSGKYRVLVATDIAARGIDVSGISHVINYDMPDTVDAYTHRIGRTGRAARTGEAFTFATLPDRDFVRSIEQVLGEKLERRRLENFDYTLPAPKGATPICRTGNQGRQTPGGKIPMRSSAGHAAVSARAAGTAPGTRRGRKDLSQCPFLKGSTGMKSSRSESVR